MRTLLLLPVLALALASCGQAGQAPGGAAGPELAAPAPESEPGRVFAPANAAANTASGQLTITVATRLPEAAAEGTGAAPTEVLTLSGANGMRLEAALSGTADPSVLVQGQTLRALMDLGVEASQTLVYRVTQAQGTLCSDGAPSHVAVWEPDGPGEAGLKVLPLMGGAPGEASARACGALAYRGA